MRGRVRLRVAGRRNANGDVPFRLHLVPDAGGGNVRRLERGRFDAVLPALEGPARLFRRLIPDAEALGR